MTPDADEEVPRPVKKSKMPVGGWGVAQGTFKDAFEEIMEETVALSHYVTNSYRTYKQSSTSTDFKLKELKKNFSELAAFKENQIKQAEE